MVDAEVQHLATLLVKGLPADVLAVVRKAEDDPIERYRTRFVCSDELWARACVEARYQYLLATRGEL